MGPKNCIRWAKRKLYSGKVHLHGRKTCIRVFDEGANCLITKSLTRIQKKSSTRYSPNLGYTIYSRLIGRENCIRLTINVVIGI